MRGRIYTGHVETDRGFDDLRGAISLLEACPLLAGVPIDGLDMEDAVTRRIRHGLGRRVRGWIRTDLTGAVSTGRIERVVDERADLSRELWLKATGWGATITVSLWVF